MFLIGFFVFVPVAQSISPTSNQIRLGLHVPAGCLNRIVSPVSFRLENVYTMSSTLGAYADARNKFPAVRPDSRPRVGILNASTPEFASGAKTLFSRSIQIDKRRALSGR